MHFRQAKVCLLGLLVLLTFSFAVAADEGAAPEIRVLFSGEVQGGFQPCGCAGGPTGGLARRLGYRDSVLKSWGGPLIQIDAGNYFADPGPDAEAINHLMLESLDRIPISVMNLGVADLYWWRMLSGRRSSGTQIISTNLVPRRAGIEPPKRFAVLEIPLGKDPSRTYRIGFLGLADPARVRPNSGFRATDPLEAVKQIKPEVMRQADTLVVLWDVIRPVGGTPADSPIRKLAEENPEISLIVTTERRDILYDPAKLGNATLVSGVERGRFMGDLRLRIESGGAVDVVDPKFIELKAGSPENPEMLREQQNVASRIQAR